MTEKPLEFVLAHFFEDFIGHTLTNKSTALSKYKTHLLYVSIK